MLVRSVRFRIFRVRLLLACLNFPRGQTRCPQGGFPVASDERVDEVRDGRLVQAIREPITYALRTCCRPIPFAHRQRV